MVNPSQKVKNVYRSRGINEATRYLVNTKCARLCVTDLVRYNTWRYLIPCSITAFNRFQGVLFSLLRNRLFQQHEKTAASLSHSHPLSLSLSLHMSLHRLHTFTICQYVYVCTNFALIYSLTYSRL